MDFPEDFSPPVRDWNADPSVVRARDLLARGRSRAAVKEAWKAASIVIRADDEGGYSVVSDLAGEIAERANGRPQRNAVVLGSYLSHCHDASVAGIRGETLFERLFGRKPAPRRKTCPDCGETVKAAALICRFCGHRFADDRKPVGG